MKASDILLDGFDYSSESILEWILLDSNTILNSNVTALVDTSVSALIITLPQEPEENDEVRIVDAKGTFNTNNVTISSDDKIMESDDNVTLDKLGTYITFVYINDIYGWKYSIVNVNKIGGVDLDTSNIDNGFILKYNASSNSFVFEQVEPNTIAPILSGPSTVTEELEAVVTITNYNASFSYDVLVDSGSVQRVGGQVTFTAPTVSSDTSYDITVTATEPGKQPNATVHVILVEDFPMITDTALLVENDGYNGFIEEGEDYELGSVTALSDLAWVMTVPEYQEEGENDFTQQDFVVDVTTKGPFNVDGTSTTSSLILDGDTTGIDDFLVKYGDDTLVEMDGNVTSQSGEMTESTFDTESVFNTADSDYISAVALDSTTICVSYRDDGNGGDGTSIIGTISGNTITWGAESVFSTADIEYTSAVKLDSTHVCISYKVSSSRGASIIGTVSGTSITFGAESVFNAASTAHVLSVALDSTTICVSYSDYGNSYYGTSIIGNISGTTITFGSEYVFSDSAIYYGSMITLDSTHICISYNDNGNGGYGTAIIGTISGTSISWGSEYIFNADRTNWISTVLLETNKFCISYMDDANGDKGTSIIGTVSGTTISFGSESVFNDSGNTQYISAVKLDETHISVSYSDIVNSHYGTNIIGTIDGTTITWGDSSVFNSGSTQYITTVKLDANNICVSYKDSGNSQYGTSIIGAVGFESTLTLTTPLSAVPTMLFDATLPEFYTAIGSEDEYIPCKDIELSNLTSVSTTGLTGESSTGSLWTSGAQHNNVGLMVNGGYLETDVLSVDERFDHNLSSNQVFDSVYTHGTNMVKLDDTHICIAYVATTSKSIIGTIDGDTISWGTEVVFAGDTYIWDIIKLDETHVCITYSDTPNSNKLTSIVGTVSGGDTISFGTSSISYGGFAQKIATVTIDSTHFAVAYNDTYSANNFIKIATISGGDTISFGSGQNFSAYNSSYGYKGMALLDSTHLIISYTDGGPPGAYPDFGYSKIGTISGNSITFGSTFEFHSGDANAPAMLMLDSTHFAVSYKDATNIVGASNVGTVSDGNVITFGPKKLFNNGDTDHITATPLDESTILIAYSSVANSYYGTCIIQEFYNEYDLTFAAQASAPTEAYKPSVFKKEDELTIDSATTTTVVTPRPDGFYDEPKAGIDTLDLVVGGSGVDGVAISNIGIVGDNYTFTFPAQASAPTEAKITGGTPLVPETIEYNDGTERIELDYPLHDFKFTPDIRQLKYYMKFNKIGNIWSKFLSNLWKS